MTVVIRVDNVGTPWEGYPQDCTLFLNAGDSICPWDGETVQYAVGQATQYTGNVALLPWNVESTYNFSARTMEVVCKGYLPLCQENTQGLNLPRPICHSLCVLYKEINDLYLSQIHAPVSLAGTGMQGYQWLWPNGSNINLTPVDCDNWQAVVYGQTVPLFPHHNYTIEYGGENITVQCIPEDVDVQLVAQGCDIDGLVSSNFQCLATCPLLLISTLAYIVIRNLEIVVSCICVLIVIVYLIVSGAVPSLRQTFYVWPHVLIPASCLYSVLLYCMLVFPWLVGWEEVWCDGGTEFPLIATTELFTNGQETYYQIQVSNLVSYGDLCTLQGQGMYLAIMSLHTFCTITVVTSTLHMLGVLLWNKRDKMPFALQLILYQHEAKLSPGGWERWVGVAFRIMVLPTVCLILSSPALLVGIILGSTHSIGFNIASTYCFVDSSNSGAYIATWIVPELAQTLVTFIAWSAMMGMMVYILYKVVTGGIKLGHGAERVKRVTNLARLVAQSTLIMVDMMLISASTMYVALDKDGFDTATSEYMQCRIIQGRSDCTLPSAPTAMAVVAVIAVMSLGVLLVLSGMASVLLVLVLERHELLVNRLFKSSTIDITGTEMTVSVADSVEMDYLESTSREVEQCDGLTSRRASVLDEVVD